MNVIVSAFYNQNVLQLVFIEEREKYEEQIISLWFKEPTYAYDEMILAGALTMTITGYLPNTEGVTIYMQQTDGSYRNLDPEGLYFTREDFSDMVGVNVYLPYPDAEGSEKRIYTGTAETIADRPPDSDGYGFCDSESCSENSVY